LVTINCSQCLGVLVFDKLLGYVQTPELGLGYESSVLNRRNFMAVVVAARDS
jgi:hypothetical protein